MNELLDWEELRRNYPYMKKYCALCAWARPTENLESEDFWCRYFKEVVDPQQEVCDYFVNQYVLFLV